MGIKMGRLRPALKRLGPALLLAVLCAVLFFGLRLIHRADAVARAENVRKWSSRAEVYTRENIQKEAHKAGVGEYYLDENQAKQFRFKCTRAHKEELK